MYFYDKSLNSLMKVALNFLKLVPSKNSVILDLTTKDLNLSDIMIYSSL